MHVCLFLFILANNEREFEESAAAVVVLLLELGLSVGAFAVWLLRAEMRPGALAAPLHLLGLLYLLK